MSSSVFAQITIGGTLSSELVQEFRDILEEELLCSDFDPSKYSLRGRGSTQPFASQWEETRYGDFPDVQEFCREHGLSYIVCTEPNGSSGYEATIWKPGFDSVHQYTCDFDPEPTWTAGQILSLLKQRKSVRKEVERVLSEFDIPPLLIEGEE